MASFTSTLAQKQRVASVAPWPVGLRHAVKRPPPQSANESQRLRHGDWGAFCSGAYVDEKPLHIAVQPVAPEHT